MRIENMYHFNFNLQPFENWDFYAFKNIKNPFCTMEKFGQKYGHSPNKFMMAIFQKNKCDEGFSGVP